MYNKKVVVLYGEADCTVAKCRPITRKYTKEGSIIWTQELMRFGIETRNGCNFNIDEFKEGIADPFVQERIRGRRFLNENDHPSKEDFERFTTVSMQNVSYRINRFWFEGNILYGECETLETASGKDLRALIEAGVEIPVSFRGYGIPKPEGGEKIVIVSFDVVYHPSNPTALSHEDTFKDKLYSEGYSTREAIYKMIENSNVLYEPIANNAHIYAESVGMPDVKPDALVKNQHGEIYGFTFTAPEELKKQKSYNAFMSRLRSI